MNPLIPLKPGTKIPAVSGWADSTYKGFDRGGDPVDVGMRCDGLVVVDCDSIEAAKFWTDKHPEPTETVRTPRGVHFYYDCGLELGPMVGVFPGIDIRSGPGSYVVVPPTPGYRQVDVGEVGRRRWGWNWLPQRSEQSELLASEGWTTVPEGRRNITLTSFAGTLRKQGAGEKAILAAILGLNRAFCSPPLPDGDCATIAHSVMRYATDPDYDIVVVDDVQEKIERYLDASRMTLPPPPEWYWRPYFPQGRLVMVDGQEGIGKGMMAVWVAVATVKGIALAPSAPTLPPAPVLWYSTEDDPEEDVLRRLYAAGYNPDTDAKVFFWNPRSSRPRAPHDLDEFVTIFRKVKPRFVFLDPGRSFIAPPEGVEGGFNNEAAVRPAMETLNRLAHDTGATILFMHHWNKKSEGSTRDKSGGSGAFQQVVRHKLTLAQIGTVRAFSVEKSNIIDRAHHVWSYDVVEVDEWETAKFVLGDALPEYQDLDEWMSVAKKLEAEGEIEIITDWRDAAVHYGSFLECGDVAPTREQIMRDLQVSQDKSKAIRAALRELGIISIKSKWCELPPEIQRTVNQMRQR